MMNRAIWNVCTWYVGALSVWFFIFYVPYAVSLYNFNYDNGAQLPSYYGLIFTMVVVGGNATMYIVCDMIAENIQFLYKDTKQVVYVLMYLAACTINVLLDMGVTYVTALKIMVGLISAHIMDSDSPKSLLSQSSLRHMPCSGCSLRTLMRMLSHRLS
jgi:hypothetical protein